MAGGFGEISNNTVNIMVDACEVAGEIDIAAAKEELAAARQQIQAATSGEDVDDLHAEIARQEARVRAVERSRQR